MSTATTAWPAGGGTLPRSAAIRGAPAGMATAAGRPITVDSLLAVMKAIPLVPVETVASPRSEAVMTSPTSTEWESTRTWYCRPTWVRMVPKPSAQATTRSSPRMASGTRMRRGRGRSRDGASPSLARWRLLIYGFGTSPSRSRPR